MHFLFPGILTLPILMANPPLDPEDSINSGSILYVMVIIHHAVQAQFTQALMTVSWPRTLAAVAEWNRAGVPIKHSWKRNASRLGLLGLLVDPVVQAGAVAAKIRSAFYPRLRVQGETLTVRARWRRTACAHLLSPSVLTRSLSSNIPQCPNSPKMVLCCSYS